jgi:CTP:molybdopterin cytidylyltransferase MocA/ADP-ribose pyrophosphatase YjhB (NUDIX family)
MLAAIILAAGKSQRLGYPKALLSLGNEPFARRLMRIASEAGVDLCRVVLGYRARDLRRILELPDGLVVVNQKYEEGQLSSLQCGLQNLQEVNCAGVLAMPVDHPMITTHLLRQMIGRFRHGGPAAVIPTHRGRRGHPTLFSRALFQELLQCPPENGARTVLNRHQEHVHYLPTADVSVLLDVDTPDDYRRLLQFYSTEWKSSLTLACEGDQHESLSTASHYCPRCSGRLTLQPTEPEGKSQRVCTVCGFILYLNPKLVSCTVPMLNGKLLLVRRSIEPCRGLWTIPGGYVDLGESTQEAAVRETLEEAGVRVTLGKLVGVYSYPHQPQVIVVYQAECPETPPIPGVETQEARYFSPEEIPWDRLAFRSTSDALRDWIGSCTP